MTSEFDTHRKGRDRVHGGRRICKEGRLLQVTGKNIENTKDSDQQWRRGRVERGEVEGKRKKRVHVREGRSEMKA